MTETLDLAQALEWARDLAQKAGKITLKHFRTNLAVELKADNSPVTQADKETEEFLRAEILARWPGHQVLGEEFGTTAGAPGSPWKWVVDPIDGTKSFIHGIPLYTVLIALMKDDEPLLGVIHCPGLDETVWAAKGLGAWYNGQPCRVSQQDSLAKAWVQTTDPAALVRRWPGSEKLLYQCLYMRTWGDAYGYLLVATGRADAMVDSAMSLWDIACLIPIIREAGGQITDLRGKNGLDSCLASNGRIHQAVLQAVSGA